MKFSSKKGEIILNVKEYVINWKNEFLRHKYLIGISIIFLIVSSILDYLSGTYTNRVGAAIAPDLILELIPPIDLEFVFTYGYLFVLFIFFAYPLFFKPKEIHEVISQFSLLVMIRSFFICFTHLKAPVDAIVVEFPWLISHLSFHNDLFFSGHTAFPFLGFLLFQESKIKYFFLAASIIMGITVLLMHVHYSIDVCSAFFISYGSYKIGKWFLKLVRK